ncbi:MAG TPA: FMN-binding glutamate synthase family protein [Bacillota bacterium]|nr:FMN-binding glutamate synthase family protein [Bacillota bacterium]
MKFIFQFLLVLGISFIAAMLTLLLAWRPVVNIFVDSFTKRLLKDPYPENIGEMVNVFKKVGIQNVLEADLRSNNGQALERPFGSPLPFSPWEKLLLNPVYLTRMPIVEAYPIDMGVLLGPQAKRPLEIKIPILIGGMAYGLGPSLQAKLALAKAASMADTATNTGVGPFLTEERQYAKKLIVQYHRGSWGKDEKIFHQADMVEIQMGYGALGSAPVTLNPENISPEFRKFMDTGTEDQLKLGATLPDITNAKDLTKLVKYLREVTNGVPIGVKIGATQYLEKELALITAAGVDFLSIDGAEAGINFGPTILADSTGLPTLPALCRTKRFLKEQGLDRKVSLIISGGLVTPGHFLKALALGADAVAIGTIAMILIAHSQLSKVIPWEPPTELVYERGKAKDKLRIDEAAQNLANYFKSCREEMILGMRSIGRTSLKELSPQDLCALTPEVARMTGVELGLYAPGSNESKQK